MATQIKEKELNIQRDKPKLLGNSEGSSDIPNPPDKELENEIERLKEVKHREENIKHSKKHLEILRIDLIKTLDFKIKRLLSELKGRKYKEKELFDKFEEYEFTNILRKFRCHNPNECMDMIKDGFKNQLQKLKEKSK